MSGKIKAILVDDEERSRDVLANLLEHFCPTVELLNKYSNLPDAVAGINDFKPDLVFLDIEMPNYAGHEIIGFFEEIDFDIVFVTAYDSYAVKAFEVAAVDYLLKPVDIERLKESVYKVEQRIQHQSMAQDYNILRESLELDQVQNIVIAEKGQRTVVPVDEIIAIEAQESYSNIYTAKRTLVASKNLKHFEGVLDSNSTFFRSHKSWIINLKYIKRYSKTCGTIELNLDIIARLSKYRKEAFEKRL